LNGEKTNVSKTLRMRTEMVYETLVFSPFNQLTQLTAGENFIIRRHKHVATKRTPKFSETPASVE